MIPPHSNEDGPALGAELAQYACTTDPDAIGGLARYAIAT